LKLAVAPNWAGLGGWGNTLRVLGNEFYNIGSDVTDGPNSKLFYVIYIQGHRATTGTQLATESDPEVGWNYIHDCHGANAVNIYNESSPAQGGASANITQHKVHDNFIVNQEGDGILIGNQCTGNNWVYNNVLINAGKGPGWNDYTDFAGID